MKEYVYEIDSERGRRGCSDFFEANDYAKAVSGKLTEIVIENGVTIAETVIADYSE